MSEVNTASKFPKAYSLTGVQIPAAKFQLQPRREQHRQRIQLTLLNMCIEVNWPCYKRKADKNDRLKQSQKEKMVKHSRVSVPVSTLLQILSSVGQTPKILQ